MTDKMKLLANAFSQWTHLWGWWFLSLWLLLFLEFYHFQNRYSYYQYYLLLFIIATGFDMFPPGPRRLTAEVGDAALAPWRWQSRSVETGRVEADRNPGRCRKVLPERYRCCWWWWWWSSSSSSSSCCCFPYMFICFPGAQRLLFLGGLLKVYVSRDAAFF